MTGTVHLKEDIVVFEDVVINDSDKSFVVPNGEEWEVLYVQAQLITTSDAGTRQMVLEILGAGAELLGRYSAGATQGISLTERYNWGPSLTDQATPISLELTVSMPSNLRLGPGFTLTVKDIAAIQPAADDMEVRFAVARRRTRLASSI